MPPKAKPKGPCGANGCPRTEQTKGYCLTHYARVLRHGDPGPGELLRKPQPAACTVEACEKRATSNGLCGMHYQRQLKHGTTDDTVGAASRHKFCTHPGCGQPHQARGFCSLHKYRHEKGLDMDAPNMRPPLGDKCIGPECDRRVLAKDLCSTHYAQAAAGNELTPIRTYKPKGEQCAANPQCTRPSAVEGMCLTHRIRYRRGGPGWDDLIPYKAPDGTGYTDPKGYRIITVNGKQHREHRYNAELELGRPLLPTEDVHHVDTNRANNATNGPFRLDERGRMRSGNLEVWAHTHPRGGEIGPQLDAALDLVERYLLELDPGRVARLQELAAEVGRS